MTQIEPADVLFMLAAPSANAGLTNGGVAGMSWGKFVSTTAWSTTPLDNLFSDLTGPENAAGQVDYACVFIYNNTQTGNSMLNAVAWLPTQNLTVGGPTMSLAADAAASSPAISTSPQAAVISQATLPPSGISAWNAASSTSAGGANLGTIAPGYVKAVWIRRTATNSAPASGWTFGLEVDFTSNS